MSGAIKASLGVLAAGNVHFAGRCAVLRLQGHAGVDRPAVSFAASWVKATAYLRGDHDPAVAFASVQSREPSTFPGKTARLALAVQYAAGLEVSADHDWREFPADQSLAVFTCPDQATGQAAAALALGILTDAQEADLEQIAQRLIEALKPWTEVLASTARSRGIPVTLAAAADRPFIFLGHGTKRRLFWRHFTPNTSHVATTISTRKDFTAKLLREAGLPAPRNRVVRDAATAVQAAEALGYPVVVKPVAADYGRGVSTGNLNAEQVRNAYLRAAEWGTVLVEEQISGDQHRLLVMHGRCVAVSRRLPARVVGDGVSTVLQLVEVVNRTRTEQLSSAGVKIKLDEVALGLLQQHGLTRLSVPAAGQVVALRGNANQSSGGTVEMMTEAAHPDVIRLAVQAAALLGIDVAGIDYLTTDITRSPDQTQGAICEVNVTPGFVNQGASEELLGTYLAPFFPGGDDGRIPTVCVVGASDGHGPLTDALVSLLDTVVARSDDVRFWRESQRPALPRRTAATLADPLAASALVTCTSQEIEATGLGLDRCTLAVLAPGVAKEAVVAMLRIAMNVVLPRSLLEDIAQDPRLAGLEHRVWLIGDGASTALEHRAGFVRRAAGDEIEICPRFGASWRLSDVPATEEAEMLVAAGAALGVPASRISESLRVLESKQG